MTLLQRLFGKPGADPREAVRPLYQHIVAAARQPAWYLDGAPDSVDGRFDMVAAILSHVLIRLEDDPSARGASAHLAELFVDDMDGQLRQIGVGDVTVGKQVGRMMAALGGRLTAYRDAAGDPGGLANALVRNLWRGQAPAGGAARVADRLASFAADLTGMPIASILAGQLPPIRA